MKTYKVEVWYRYVYNGEQEKEFEQHTIDAETPTQAIEIALDKYRTLNEIPFKATIL